MLAEKESIPDGLLGVPSNEITLKRRQRMMSYEDENCFGEARITKERWREGEGRKGRRG